MAMLLKIDWAKTVLTSAQLLMRILLSFDNTAMMVGKFTKVDVYVYTCVPLVFLVHELFVFHSPECHLSNTAENN